jgi:hypothetical protein
MLVHLRSLFEEGIINKKKKKKSKMEETMMPNVKRPFKPNISFLVIFSIYNFVTYLHVSLSF